MNQSQFTPRLADFELSLYRAMRLCTSRAGRSGVEKVPLCYMTDFAWASTETRKIVKGEERIVHFLDAKQTVRQQTDWGHRYALVRRVLAPEPSAAASSTAAAPTPGCPVFIDRDAVVDHPPRPARPELRDRSMAQWRGLQRRKAEPIPLRPARAAGRAHGDVSAERLPVGMVTDQGLRLFRAKRLTEGRRRERLGIALERPDGGVENR